MEDPIKNIDKEPSQVPSPITLKIKSVVTKVKTTIKKSSAFLVNSVLFLSLVCLYILAIPFRGVVMSFKSRWKSKTDSN